MKGYLFVHFVGEKDADGEQVYFSVSEDGLHWRDLNGGKPVLRSALGDGGVRDPFIVRHPVTGKYYLMATDLSMFSRRDWSSAEHRGSRALIVWESDHLTDWSEARRVDVGAREAGCVWAPEAIWVEEKGAFLVFFASMVHLAGDAAPKQRIYAAWTTDFLSFSEPFVYAEAENHLIDMTIVRDGAWYFRFIKDETTKRIIVERMRDLFDAPQDVHSQALENLSGVEGPECYPLPDGRWCLIVDRFAAGLGYLPLVTDDLSSGRFEVVPSHQYHFGTTPKRHGGVISISQEDMQRLSSVYP